MTERDGGGRWLRGSGSPNPGGRPPLSAEIRGALRARTSEAIATLAEIMHDTSAPAAARVAAARTFLDHGIGKPLQAVSIAGAERPTSVEDMTTAELERFLTERLKLT